MAGGEQERAARRGMILVLVAACCFGTLGVFSKRFYDAGGDAWTLLFLRFAVTGPLLLAAALLGREERPSRRTALAGAALGVFQLGVGLALFEGFARAPVALVTLLYFAYPVVTALGAAALFRERLGPRRLAILALAVAGIALTIGVPESATWAGIALGLAAGLCVAALIISSRFLLTRRELGPLMLCGLMFTSPALVLAAAAPARAPDFELSGAAWGWVLAAVLVSATLPIGLFYAGVRRVEAGVTGMLSSAEPLVSVLLATAVLGEALGALQLAGGVLIVLAVVLLGLETARRPVG